MISLIGSFWFFVVFASRQFGHSLFTQTDAYTIQLKYAIVQRGMVWCNAWYVLMYIMPNAI